MKVLDVSIRDKIDLPLREALEGSEEFAYVSAILLLNAPPQPATLNGAGRIDPRAYPTGEAYRSALIQLRREHLRLFVEPVLHRFSSLGLRTIAGGDLTPVVSVVGSPAQIAEAVAFPEVRLARLDGPALVVPAQPV